MAFDKGARVQIKPGNQGAGVCGEVFWKGPKKWGTGERLGVRGDDGETYWIDEADVEASDQSAPPVEAGDTFEKRDRVSFRVGGREGTGTVFWIGASKRGPGQRLGINDDEGEEAVWIDARFAKALGDSHPPSGSMGVVSEESEVEWSPSVNMDEQPGPPPIDGDTADQWANAFEDEDDDVF